MVDFSFIVSLYVSDLLNVTISKANPVGAGGRSGLLPHFGQRLRAKNLLLLVLVPPARTVLYRYHRR